MKKVFFVFVSLLCLVNGSFLKRCELPAFIFRSIKVIFQPSSFVCNPGKAFCQLSTFIFRSIKEINQPPFYTGNSVKVVL